MIEPKVSFKPGVEVDEVALQVLFIISVVARVYADHGYESVTVTSITDGKHRDNSKHYEGKAADFRIWFINTMDLRKIVKAIQARLGDDYDVVLEDTHIHVEYDPKGEA